MTSLPIRDPGKDHLLTPKNAALVLIDYQPPQIYTVRSMETGKMINNVIALTRLAKVFGLPIVLSTVNVSNGVNLYHQNPGWMITLLMEGPFDRTEPAASREV